MMTAVMFGSFVSTPISLAEGFLFYHYYLYLYRCTDVQHCFHNGGLSHSFTVTLRVCAITACPPGSRAFNPGFLVRFMLLNLVFCVIFCRSLFSLLSFYLWSLHCLLFWLTFWYIYINLQNWWYDSHLTVGWKWDANRSWNEYMIRLLRSHDTIFVESLSIWQIGGKIWRKIVLCDSTFVWIRINIEFCFLSCLVLNIGFKIS